MRLIDTLVKILESGRDVEVVFGVALLGRSRGPEMSVRVIEFREAPRPDGSGEMRRTPHTDCTRYVRYADLCNFADPDFAVAERVWEAFQQVTSVSDAARNG